MQSAHRQYIRKCYCIYELDLIGVHVMYMHHNIYVVRATCIISLSRQRVLWLQVAAEYSVCVCICIVYVYTVYRLCCAQRIVGDSDKSTVIPPICDSISRKVLLRSIRLNWKCMTWVPSTHWTYKQHGLCARRRSSSPYIYYYLEILKSVKYKL